jgi:flavin-dependent dehydrogenase
MGSALSTGRLVVQPKDVAWGRIAGILSCLVGTGRYSGGPGSHAVRVIVIGGGAAGLGAALCLSRSGHEVTVLEGDPTPLPADPLTAFERWERRGAPQVWHSHAFLGRLRNLLVKETPDVYQSLLEHGAYEVRFGQNLPAGIQNYEPLPEDEDLTLLGCRRITFEWVVRHIVEEDSRLRWCSGVRVEGLRAEADSASGVPRIVGVQCRGPEGPESFDSDLVVDASGRRSRLAAWLLEIGAEPLEDDSEDCGIFYCSRFYRLRPGVSPPAGATLVGADLGYMKYAIFPGDSGIFSVTLAASPEDAPLRAIFGLSHFEAAVRAIPTLASWLQDDSAEPVSSVRAMSGLRNRRRRLVRDGAPVVLGVHALGDAAMHTNPLYGRGCTLAFVHAWLLDAVLREHPRDPVARSLAFHEATERELGPWYRAARDQDRESRRVADAERRGERAPAAFQSQPGKRVDPNAFMRSVLRDGLLPAMRSDAIVLRAFARTFNLLTPPDALLSNPDVMQRVLAVWQQREMLPRPEPQGPGRDEMVEVLAEVA